jgi:hypothetical protein
MLALVRARAFAEGSGRRSDPRERFRATLGFIAFKAKPQIKL